MTSQTVILQEIVDRREYQDRKFGPQTRHSPERWLIIAVEEIGEVSRAINDKDWKNYRDELIDMAAVALAAIECFDEMEMEV